MSEKKIRKKKKDKKNWHSVLFSGIHGVSTTYFVSYEMAYIMLVLINNI